LRAALVTIAALTFTPSIAERAEAAAPPPPAPLTGGWVFARTPVPGSSQSSVAVMHIVDAMRSDIGLAGLMFRCGEHGIDTILIVVTPYPPSASLDVTLTNGGDSRKFSATVLPTGAALALPAAASDLMQTIWRRADALSVAVSDHGATLSGVVPTEGLDAAVGTLSASCAER
jgi:hypothetical protein